jgi:hypothetical protein
VRKRTTSSAKIDTLNCSTTTNWREETMLHRPPNQNCDYSIANTNSWGDSDLPDATHAHEHFSSLFDHKVNANAARMKMKAIKRYALDRETYLQYALGAIIIIVAVFIAMFGLLRCMR